MRYLWIRLRRKPFAAVAVVLFYGLIGLALCSLHRGIICAQGQYYEI